jgi:hypothetical protein
VPRFARSKPFTNCQTAFLLTPIHALIPECPVEAIYSDMSFPEEYTEWLEKNKEAENYPIISTKVPALFGPGCKGQPE